MIMLIYFVDFNPGPLCSTNLKHFDFVCDHRYRGKMKKKNETKLILTIQTKKSFNDYSNNNINNNINYDDDDDVL